MDHRTMMISSSSLSSASSSSSSSSSSTMPHKLSSGSNTGPGTCACGAGGTNSLLCSSNLSLSDSLSSAVNQCNDSITINNGPCNSNNHGSNLPLIPCSNDCSFCWSSSSLVSNATTPTQLHQTATLYNKSRTIRLRKSDPNVSLGFSIRGGWEHGIGFYVSEVQPDSIAAKHGLCAGDQIIRINGFPLERVIHEEVVALVRLSATDLTLQVRSAGIVPLKGKPNEKLTWKRLCAPKEGTEVNSFVYTRPRSTSLSITPSSTPTLSLEDTDEQLSDEQESPEFESHSNLLHHTHRAQHHHNQHHHNDHHSSQLQLHSSHQSSTSTLSSSAASRAVFCSNYTEKHLYIRCHQPGSSLGCSVVNGPASCPGIFVQHIKEGKLAQKCGLEIGDQIVKVNNVDVAAIGFDGAITLLKSLSNLSLLIRKGVARHIFECTTNSREQYDNLFGSKECHFNTIQYHCSKSQSSSSAAAVVPKSLSTFLPPDSHHSQVSSNSGHHHHHQHHPHLQPYSHYYQYKTIATGPQVPSDDITTTAANNNNNNYSNCSNCSSQFCTAYSSVQISSTASAPVVGSCSAGSVASASSSSSGLSSMSSCEKNRCCCKRQRTIGSDPLSTLLAANGNGSIPPPPQIISCSTAAAAGMCTLLVANNHNSVGTVSADHLPQLFADSGNLDKVTSAMANSIRILQEVREKEEKLVEASRKLNEEHQKLCREKEKLENEKKELNERSSCLKENRPPPPAEHHDLHLSSLNSQYSTASTAPASPGTAGHRTSPGSLTTGGSNSSSASNTTAGATNSRRSVITGPTFSFLEEIKALGIDGGKRHLRPVNSNNLDIGKGKSGDYSNVNGNTNSTDSNSTATNRTKPDPSTKLRRSPFGLTNNVIKDVDKQRQHELLMEEFRIAHQRMFGGTARDDSGTGGLGLARFKLNKVNNRTNKSMPNICSGSVDDDDDNQNDNMSNKKKNSHDGDNNNNNDHHDTRHQQSTSNHDPSLNNRKTAITSTISDSPARYSSNKKQTSSSSSSSTKQPAPPPPPSKDYSSNQYHHQPLSRQTNYHHHHHNHNQNINPNTRSNNNIGSFDTANNIELSISDGNGSNRNNSSNNVVNNNGNNRITIKVLSPKIVPTN